MSLYSGGRRPGFGCWDVIGLRVQGLIGSWVWGLGSRVQGLGPRVNDLRFRMIGVIQGVLELFRGIWELRRGDRGLGFRVWA